MARFGDARLPDRFWDKVAPEPNSGCWLWMASANSKGYGEFFLESKLCRAHRVAYEALVGLIPIDLVIDHLCRVRCCVNPDHLQAVTQRENLLRGAGLAAQMVSRTHCPQGHPYSGENLYVDYHGHRICRACSRIASRDRKRRVRQLKRETHG